MTTDLVKRLRDAEPKVTRLARAVGMSVEDTGLCTEAAYLIESQAKEIERLRKDAERYRWLRCRGADVSRPRFGGTCYIFACGDKMDRFIDAALKDAP